MSRVQEVWRKWKKEVAKIFATEVAKEVIRYGLGLLGLGLVVRFWSFLSNALLNSVTLPVTQWSISEISVVSALLLLLLALSFFLGRFLKPRQEEEEKFFFVDFMGFLWKAFRPSARVEDLPYCKEHKSQIFIVGNHYFCETCHDAKTQKLHWELVHDLHKGAKSRAEAIIFNHAKAKILG